MPETHMLKPFANRVGATYALMKTMIEQAAIKADGLRSVRKKAIAEIKSQKTFPLTWIPDSSKFSKVVFKGYEQDLKRSEATGLQRMYYNHNKPFTKEIKFLNVFMPQNFVSTPAAYVIPQGWWNAIDL